MALVRRFIFHPISGEQIILPEIDPGMSEEQHRDFYASQYPELTTAAIHTSDVKDGVQTYGFHPQAQTPEGQAPAGTKGSPATEGDSYRDVHLRPSIGRKG